MLPIIKKVPILFRTAHGRLYFPPRRRLHHFQSPRSVFIPPILCSPRLFRSSTLLLHHSYHMISPISRSPVPCTRASVQAQCLESARFDLGHLPVLNVGERLRRTCSVNATGKSQYSQISCENISEAYASMAGHYESEWAHDLPTTLDHDSGKNLQCSTIRMQSWSCRQISITSAMTVADSAFVGHRSGRPLASRTWPV